VKLPAAASGRPLLNPTATVRREMPNKRSMPHKLIRSSTVSFIWIRVIIIAPVDWQCATVLADFTVVFLVAFAVVAVSHYILTAAFRIRIRYNRLLYHEKELQVDFLVCLFTLHQSKPHHYPAARWAQRVANFLFKQPIIQ
jgi:hypothetical protein